MGAGSSTEEGVEAMRRLISVSVVLLVLAGCGEEDLQFPGGSTTATPTVTSTATPGPTSTPTPTPTPTP